MMFSIKEFFSKCDQIHSFLRIWSHLLKKSLMENFIFCAVTFLWNTTEYSGKLFWDSFFSLEDFKMNFSDANYFPNKSEHKIVRFPISPLTA